MGSGDNGAAKSAQELLQEFRETGAQAPFEEVVRRYAGMVFHTCHQITHNVHDAEDATQAVFLTLATQVKTNREIKCVGPWLQQVAYRLSLDQRKSKKRRELRETRHSLLKPSWVEGADDAVDMEDLRGVLNEELNKLPPKYRMPLILHYFGGLTREEMARELGCKPSTLGVRLFRGREMLGHRLAERGMELTAGVLTVAIAYAVNTAVNESLVSSTSYAAMQIATGHQVNAGLVSAEVMTLVRSAASAAAMAKAKAIIAVVLLAGSAVATGAQVVSRVQPLDIRFDFSTWNISQKLWDLFRVSPLLQSSAAGAARNSPASAPQLPPLASAPAIQVPFPTLPEGWSDPLLASARPANPESLDLVSNAAASSNQVVTLAAQPRTPAPAAALAESAAPADNLLNTAGLTFQPPHAPPSSAPLIASHTLPTIHPSGHGIAPERATDLEESLNNPSAPVLSVGNLPFDPSMMGPSLYAAELPATGMSPQQSPIGPSRAAPVGVDPSTPGADSTHTPGDVYTDGRATPGTPPAPPNNGGVTPSLPPDPRLPAAGLVKPELPIASTVPAGPAFHPLGALTPATPNPDSLREQLEAQLATLPSSAIPALPLNILNTTLPPVGPTNDASVFGPVSLATAESIQAWRLNDEWQLFSQGPLPVSAADLGTMDGNDPGSYSIVLTPEPTGCLVLVGGAVCLLTRRRRSRK